MKNVVQYKEYCLLLTSLFQAAVLDQESQACRNCDIYQFLQCSMKRMIPFSLYSIAFALSVLAGQQWPPESVDVKGNRMGGVSWHASSAGQLMD